MRPCTLLFGSIARGDSGESSDIDLLVSEDFGKIYNERSGRIEVQYTPQDHLLNMAANGSLFVAHLVYEAKIVSDPDNFFSNLKNSFKVKKSYKAEQSNALSLAAYLRKRKTRGPQHFVKNKRIAWCVRTVLISLLAEQGKFVFSPQRLSEIYSDPRIEALLSYRRSKLHHKNINQNIDWFLNNFDGEHYTDFSLIELLKDFKMRDNAVGDATVRSLKKAQHPSGYDQETCYRS